MRFFGHPIHPMLVHFPIAFWTLAAAAYVAAAAGAGGPAHRLALFANAIGLVMALPAVVAGLLELRTLGEQPFNVAMLHMMAMLTAWILFLVALLLPFVHSIAAPTATIGSAACAVVGFLAMAAGGWLGGRLVYEFGAGRSAKTTAM